ncbi:MAG: acetoacetate--CoA ligase [Endozoicomonas sp. (ex Botrylloides leachii)]|nr:acetoacetate--CoA ligase [Endozoicomonas sp. (ex Botrylloides leachii)]
MSSILWSPDIQRIQDCSLSAFIAFTESRTGLCFSDYSMLYQWSVRDRVTFWQILTEFFNIQFHHRPSAILEQDAMPGAKWFSDATLNYAEHLLRPQHKGTAIIFRGEKSQRSTLSFAELVKQVAAAQAGLLSAGVVKGDRVSAILPNCLETMVLMLATTALGAVWSSCSPDFGVQSVIDRFNQIKPKVLIVTDGYFYNGKMFDWTEKIAKVQSGLDNIALTVVVPFTNQDNTTVTNAKTILYEDFLDLEQHAVFFEPVAFNHPLFILYSSGTTGVPKCIVHGHGGTLLQHLKELGLHTDVKTGDRVFFFTTCGWMMWNWLASALALGATLVLYEGSPFYPKSTTLFDIAEQEQITVFGTSAKYITALEKSGAKPIETHDLSHLKTLLSTGSPLADESFNYVYKDIKNNICLSSISGGTDIISCFVLGCPILPVVSGQIQCRGLAMDVQFINQAGQPVIGSKGELVCQSSFPSMPIGFFNDPDGSRYQHAYFSQYPGIWCHGDYGELTPDGGVIIHGRSDAILNPGGVRIGTAEIYRQVEKINDVVESIAIGQTWEDDVRIILFVILREDKSLSDALIDQIKSVIRVNASPRHVPEKILQVEDIPRTLNGKIAELAVKALVHGLMASNKEALANPEALTCFCNRKELYEP